jgi:hypothetical protein
MSAKHVVPSVVIAAALICVPGGGASEIIFESATMGQTVDHYSGFPIVGDFQFLGVRFTLEARTQIDQIGGHLIRYMDPDLFVTIVPLEEDGFPVDPGASTPPPLDTVALAHALLVSPFPESAEIFGDVDVVLDPGTYGMVFGGGLFGVYDDRPAVMVTNGQDIDSPEYFFWEDWDNYWRDGGFSNGRFVIMGTVVNECAGDIDGDGDTDLADLAALLAAYDTCTGDPGFNPDADFDTSGCVDLSDLAFLLADYGCGA